MIQEIQLRLPPREASSEHYYRSIVADNLSVDVKRINHIRLLKKSVDARQRNIWINMKLQVFIDEEPKDDGLRVFDYKNVENAKPVIIVGAGPAGLFAALRLLEDGKKPIVLERGKAVHERKKDIAQIYRNGDVNPDSNYGFGEGGAGTFSDGKLYTRSLKRGDVRKVLEVFVHHGASRNILVEAQPHIGTDKLPAVIENMRNTILQHGGEVHFSTKVTQLIIESDSVTGVITSDGQEFRGPVIFATGHSARDMYDMLIEQHVALEQKTFAVGVRLEHPQELIDQIQYHNPKGRGEYLPAAPYSMVQQVDDRGVYSFCMCPGGYIVPAATGPEQLVVNGMSPSGRNSRWANSGMVVEVHPEDLARMGFRGIEAGIKFQEAMEYNAFIAASRTQSAPSQRMADFINGKISSDLPSTSYVPGVTSAPLHLNLPPFVGERLQKGFKAFGRKANQFLTNEAVLVGVETRTSSPIRIPRDRETLQHIVLKGFFPCGEGAGYAGGIVSSAMDGEKCAEKLNELFVD